MSDTDRSDEAEPVVESTESISLTAAEEAVELAESRAEEARARATELRQQAHAGTTDDVDPVASSRARRILSWRPRRPSRTAVGLSAAAVLVTGSLVATGYMVYQHMSLTRERRHAAEVSVAARRGVEMMMSLDPKHARDDVMTLIDNTTGELQSQLRATSTMLIQNTQKADVTTKATVQDVAVVSMGRDSAVALVVAQSDTTNPDNSKRPPVYWRISVDLTRSDGQLKMSKVDFVQ